jgi:peptide subunit release factor 1 (eRF1)
MQTNELTPERLQHLAALRPEGARVLSVYLNLDPTEFATPPARASEIGSLIDEAGRKVKGEDGLSHAERRGLEEDVKRVRDFLRSPSFSADGAHGLALFSATPAGVFETVKLPRPVESRVVVDDSPWIEPLAGMLATARWAVLLANRRSGRLFAGDRDTLTEVERFREDVRGQSDTGGWSEAGRERAQAEEHEDVLRRAVYETFKELRRAPFDHLLIGVPAELRGTVEHNLHASLAERLRAFIEVDVEHSSAEDVVRAAAPAIEATERAREREQLDRVFEGMGAGGRGTAGLDDTLGALNERRVEALLIEEGFSAPGSVCASCSYVTARDDGECPADGGELVPRADIVETAIELALAQSAEVLVVRHHDDLREHGSIGAILRF